MQQFSGHHHHQYPFDRQNEHLNKTSTTIVWFNYTCKLLGFVIQFFKSNFPTSASQPLKHASVTRVLYWRETSVSRQSEKSPTQHSAKTRPGGSSYYMRTGKLTVPLGKFANVSRTHTEVSDNRALRGMFRCRTVQVTAVCRNFQSKELHDLYCPLNTYW